MKFYTYSTKFDFDNNTFNWSWSTGNGGIFSDWQVDPVMDSYFLFKTDKNSPKQLIAFKRFPSGRFGSTYLVNMYSYNNIEECGTYRLAFTPTNNPPKTNSSIYNISNNNEIVLFPNPAKDEVTIKFNTKNLDNTITFVDIQGKVIVELVNQNSQEVKIDTREFKQGIYFVKVKNSVSFTIYKLIIN